MFAPAVQTRFSRVRPGRRRRTLPPAVEELESRTVPASAGMLRPALAAALARSVDPPAATTVTASPVASSGSTTGRTTATPGQIQAGVALVQISNEKLVQAPLSAAAQVPLGPAQQTTVGSFLATAVGKGETVAPPIRWFSTGIESGGGQNAQDDYLQSPQGPVQALRPAEIAARPPGMPQPQPAAPAGNPGQPRFPILAMEGLSRPACEVCFADPNWVTTFQAQPQQSRPHALPDRGPRPTARIMAAMAALPVLLSQGWRTPAREFWKQVRQQLPK